MHPKYLFTRVGTLYRAETRGAVIAAPTVFVSSFTSRIPSYMSFCKAVGKAVEQRKNSVRVELICRSWSRAASLYKHSLHLQLIKTTNWVSRR